MEVQVCNRGGQAEKIFPGVEVVLSIKSSPSKQEGQKTYYDIQVDKSRGGVNWRMAIAMAEIARELFVEEDPSITQLEPSHQIRLSESDRNTRLDSDMIILKDNGGKVHLLTGEIGDRGQLILKDIYRQLMQKIRLDIP